MKGIINCAPIPNSWTSKYFSHDNPYLLPYLGKRLIEYYIDYCVLCNLTEVLILQHDYDEDLTRFLEDGSKWGIKIIHSTASDNDTPETIIAKKSSFVGTESILFLDGYFFPLYDKNFKENFHSNKAPFEIPYLSVDEIPTQKSLKIFIANGNESSVDMPCRPIEVDNLKKYYSLSMNLLRECTDSLIMEGYSAESDVSIGMNVVVKSYANLTPPIVVGDNVQIESGARIGPCAIIGHNCIIDSRTRIKESVIFNHTYVGADLEVSKKVICGSKIIDPINDVVVDFYDEQFSSRLGKSSIKWAFKRGIQSVFSMIMLVWLSICYIPFLIFGTPSKRKVAYMSNFGKISRITIYRPTPRLRDIWFFKLSLDRIPKLIEILRGRMSLVGDTVRDFYKEEEIMKRYKCYRAGAFTYADSLAHRNAYDSVIDDLYYRYNRSLRTDMQLILCSYFIRLFSDYSKFK